MFYKYKENILYLLFTLAAICISIANITMLSGYFSIEEYGLYQLLQTYIGILLIFNLTGYDVYTQKKILSEEIEYFYYVMKRILPLSAFILNLIFIIVYLFELENSDIIYLAFGISLFALFDKLSSFLEIKKRFKEIRYIELVVKLSFISLTILTIILGLEFKTYILCLSVLYIIFSGCKIIYSFKLASKYKRNKLLLYNETKSFNKAAIMRTFSISYATLSSWVERLVLGTISPVSLAVFSIGYLVPKILKDNVKILLKPTLFEWVHLDNKSFYEKVKLYKFRLFILGLLSVILIAVLIVPFIEILFPKYQDSIIISQILSIQLLLIFMIYPMATYLLYTNNTKKVNRIENISNTIKIITSLTLIPYLNISGALISIIVSEAIRQFLYYKTFFSLGNGNE